MDGPPDTSKNKGKRNKNINTRKEKENKQEKKESEGQITKKASDKSRRNGSPEYQ